MKKIFKLVALLVLSSAVINHSISAPTKPREKYFAYPKGYYDGDPLPEKTAYLTFDDGPSDWTAGLLDELKKENIKATFFISAYWNNKKHTGSTAYKKYKGSLLRMVKEGHAIGNHTADHKILTKLTADEIRDQLDRNQRLLNRVLGKNSPAMKIMRPPLGYPWYKHSSIETKARIGKTLSEKWIVILWTKNADSSDSWDWAEGEWFRNNNKIDTNTVAFKNKMIKIHDRILSRADGRGMIILFHDSHNTTLKVLPSIIKDLKNKGYK